nr:uncharacterized protein LOC125630626 isoform X1 [Caretta caretta]
MDGSFPIIEVRPSPVGGFSHLQAPMPVQQRKVKGTPSDINVIYESKDEGTANAQAGPAAVIAASPSASPWWLSTTILGPICLILLILVIMMTQQVYQLSQKSEQQLEVTEMENIVLLDTLQQLTTGKEDNCSMCEVDWDQQAASCYSFSKNAKSWHNSLDACTAMSASLVKIDTKKELVQSRLLFSSLLILVADKTIAYTLTLCLHYSAFGNTQCSHCLLAGESSPADRKLPPPMSSVCVVTRRALLPTTCCSHHNLSSAKLLSFWGGGGYFFNTSE